MFVDGKEVEDLMHAEDLGSWLNQRRLELVGPRMADLARAMRISRPKVSDLCAGRIIFGKRYIDRLNAIDPTFEVLRMVVLLRKTPVQVPDGDL